MVEDSLQTGSRRLCWDCLLRQRPFDKTCIRVEEEAERFLVSAEPPSSHLLIGEREHKD